MSQPRPVYIPKTIGEVMDLLGSFMLSSPTFKDEYFSERTIDTEFYRLNEGLKLVRNRLGEDRYGKLIELSKRMRAHFEADPEDKTEDAIKGRELILEMEDLLKLRRSPKEIN